MLTQQPDAPRRAAITTIFTVLGMSHLGIELTASHTGGGRSTTTPEAVSEGFENDSSYDQFAYL